MASGPITAPLTAMCRSQAVRANWCLTYRGDATAPHARLKARPEILSRRRETVELPFGLDQAMDESGAFLMRGLDNVRGEFSLTALAYNLRRALNIVASR